MTNTTAPTPATVTGSIEHIDPTTLIIEANVRPSRPLTTEFVNDVSENGIHTPITAHRDSDGNVLVRTGQRRTLAARAAGLPTIPVYLVDVDDTTTTRIVDQVRENLHREALTDGDIAAAYHQLAFEGMNIPAIAKRIGVKTSAVKKGIAVAENANAASAISTHNLTLDQAAALIEFDDDETLTKDLIETATQRPEQFAHAAQRARDEKTRTALKETASAEAIAQGFAILENKPSYYDNTPTNISDLVDADGVTPDAARITGMTGASAHVAVYATGTVTLTYYLDDPKAHGFRSRRSTISAPMTDEQKAERKILIANNKAWDSAQIVRRDWLATLLTRKTLPKDATTVIATGLTAHRHAVGAAVSGGNTLATTLLGIDTGDRWGTDKLTELLKNTPNKAGHVALAIILAAIEDNTDRTTWRHPNATKSAYFTQLETWGYTLSEVEQLAITK